MRGQPHQIRIYRAHVRGLELIDAPAEPRAHGSHVLFQARVEHARLENRNPRGICLEGPIFELLLEAPRLTHPARYQGRVFGRVEGAAIGCFELPEEPEAKELVAQAAAQQASQQAPVEAPPAEATPAVRVVPLDPMPDAPTPTPASTESTPHSTDAVHVPPEAIGPIKRPPPSSLPLFALVAALALTLLVTAGAGTAGLWLAFLLPSLLVRRFLRGVLPDATAFRAIGAILIGAQVCCVSLILLGWSTAPCKELNFLPLIALVAGVFFASVLPYLLPIAINTVGFALVLGLWSAGPGEACATRAARPEPSQVAPSVKHPGEPRTNDDGSWPKRPAKD